MTVRVLNNLFFPLTNTRNRSTIDKVFTYSFEIESPNN